MTAYTISRAEERQEYTFTGDDGVVDNLLHIVNGLVIHPLHGGDGVVDLLHGAVVHITELLSWDYSSKKRSFLPWGIASYSSTS